MSGKREALMVQILFATARGAGGMRISRQASAWLCGRYRPWLTETKPGLSQPPAVLWEDRGRGFLAKLKEIGEQARAAATGSELTVEDFVSASAQVEAEALCPWCPDGPPVAGLEMETPLPEAVLGQIVFALARGAGAMRLSLDAAAWFHDRYAPWLTATKEELIASPLEIWELMGKGFLARFREIGKGVRGMAGAEISREELQASAWAVEAEALCPYCPIIPPGVLDVEVAGGAGAEGVRRAGSLAQAGLPA
jgi:hypothetical protein